MISNTFDILLSSLISPRKQKRFLTSVLSNHPATEDCEKCFPTPTPNDIPESIKRSSGCHQFGKLRCQQLSPSLPATVDWQQLFLCRRPETSSWHTEKERVNVCVWQRERHREWWRQRENCISVGKSNNPDLCQKMSASDVAQAK